MPYGYLTTVALVAWVTGFAVRPPRPRASNPASLTHWSAMVSNEIPALPALWVVAATGLAWSGGDLATTPARAVAALAALTTAGLAVVGYRGFLARPALERALPAGPHDPTPIRYPLLRRAFQPLPIRPRGVVRIAAIPYAPGDRHRTADVYRRRDTVGPAPTLIFLHGGAFRGGDKHREGRALMHRLASHGWVAISANYRLAPSACYADQLHDVQALLGWVRTGAAGHGARQGPLVLCGSSAGAHLAATAALTDTLPRTDPADQPDSIRQNLAPAGTGVGAIAAVVCLYGYYGPVDDQAPARHAHPDAPPFLVIHGDRDTVVVPEDARRFVAGLRRAGARVTYVELPWAQHTFDLLRSPRCEAVIDAIQTYTTTIL
jgi:acetyl esterase/lipase